MSHPRTLDTAAAKLPPASPMARPFAGRTAFLLNANARAVSPRVARRLLDMVPEGDLFFSRSIEDAKSFLLTILRRGYDRLFVGGGDGTIVFALNEIRRLCDEHGFAAPEMGVLKLGTGNAMAYLLGSQSPVVDTWHLTQKGELSTIRVDMIESHDGVVTPFAGMGYDGEVLNDYMALKAAVKGPIGHHLVQTVWGYLGAMLTRTVPRHFNAKKETVKITSREDAIFMRATDDGDEEVVIPAGTVLYDGPAAFLSVGTIPYFGYGFTMFPFARNKPGYFQLRVGAVPVPTILANLYPGVWKGTFRHPKMFDFLVKDVDIESSGELAYQVGGDAAGHAKTLRFKVAKQPVEFVVLGPRLKPAKNPLTRLLPAFAPKRA